MAWKAMKPSPDLSTLKFFLPERVKPEEVWNSSGSSMMVVSASAEAWWPKATCIFSISASIDCVTQLAVA